MSVFSLPSLRLVAEVGIDEGSQACLIGTSAVRLMVLTPSGTLFVVNPLGADGPTEVTNFTMAPASTLLTASGDYALINGSTGLMVLDCSNLPTLSRFPVRSGDIELARPLGVGHFLVQLSGVLEEWSGPARSPLRRFRLERAFSAMQMGGGMRFLWFIARDAPTHIVVVPLTSGSPPIKIQLPEPAVSVVQDQPGLQLAVVGETTGALHVVSLIARTVTTLVPAETSAAAWRGTNEILRVTASALELVPLVKPTGDAAPTKPAEPTPIPTTSQRLAAWKKKVQTAKEAAAAAPSEGTDAPSANVAALTVTIDNLDRVVPLYQWRDAIASWTRALLRGAQREPPLLAACSLHDVSARLGLSIEGREFLWLLYGARLCGERGVAPADLVDVSPNRWDDALGRSHLKSSGAFEWHEDNRVHLALEVSAALDELPPIFGTEISSSVAPNRRMATIAPGPFDAGVLANLAAQLAPIAGAILVANDRGIAEPDHYLREAAIRGLAPIVPAAWLDRRPLPNAPSVIIVPDERTAKQLRLEVVAPVPV